MPENDPMRTFTFRIKHETYDKVVKYAKKARRTKGDLVRILLEWALEKQGK